VGNYLAVGVVVWLIDPVARTVEIYTPGHAVVTLNDGQTLSGGDVLPGFSVPVKDLFPTA